MLGCALALALAAPPAGCASSGSSITIMVAWSGVELQAFRQLADGFQSQYGVHVNIESTRALTQELAAAIQQDQQPDLAALPSLGAVYQYQRAGQLKPLEQISAGQYPQPWRGLMSAGGTSVVAVPVKVSIQSLIWSDKKSFPGPLPTTWSALLGVDKAAEASGKTPWCLAVASESTSGWPGTDWIKEILLAQSTPDQYQAWVEGGSDSGWRTGPAARAWQTWGQLVTDPKALYAPASGLLTETLGSAYVDMAKGRCLLSRGAYVDQGFDPAKPLDPGMDFATFPGFGRASPIEASGDFVGIFRDSTPAQEFIRYLMQQPQQEQWVTADPGALSIVSGLTYPNAVLTRISRMLNSPRYTLCFDASDAMPPDLSDAFNHAVLQYLDDPSQLPDILSGLDRAQARAKADGAPFVTTPVCGTA